MVPVIKILAVAHALVMSPPIRIAALKILPVNGMGLIPLRPPGRIPVTGPDYIGGGISVIRGPSVSAAKKVIQEAI
jgi:hypothetical protein